MLTYLIRTKEYIDGFKLPMIHIGRVQDVFTPPPEFGCEQIQGWGDYRLRCGETEISFSGEPVGYQVAFEGPMEESEAERLVAVLSERVSREVNEPTEWVRIQ